MTTPAAFYWIRSTRPDLTNVLGLAIATDEESDQTLLLACTNDGRLAGHLDPLFEVERTGLPYFVAVLSHVASWVDNSRLKPAGGLITAEDLVEVEKARAGQKPSIRTGRYLGDPAVELRWPLIELRCRYWLEVAGGAA
jgi:hypothetical protein